MIEHDEAGGSDAKRQAEHVNEPDITRAAQPGGRRRAPRGIRVLAWLVAGLAACWVLFAWLWPDMGDEGRVVGALNWLAFAGRTFSLHTAIALGLLSLLMMLRRVRFAGALTLTLALWCAVPTLWSLRPRGAPPPPGGETLSVYSVNAQIGYVDPVRLRDDIERLDADIVVIIEHHPRLHAVLPALRERYPHVFESLRDDAFGMAVLSKRQFADVPRAYPDLGVALTEPQIRCVVRVDGREVVVQGVHTLPPVSVEHLREQRRLIRALAAWAANEPRPVILAGDFNCTPESQGAGWLRGAGLREAWDARGFGPGNTWPVDAGLFSAVGVKIDHVFVGGGLAVWHAEKGGKTGSDHRGLLARVGFP
ncbi:MAG: endonuclease/exonuclease/phosphatase family protein [Planctomycetota bacterium]|nr:endonuclease/exonuclease/phosphatase family protein [Planctomycetota bacterium]